MTLDKKGALDSDRMTIIEMSPTLETAVSEFPTHIPNPNIDGGGFTNASAALEMSLDGTEDRVIINDVKEDPLRNRLLAVAMTNITASSIKQLYLYSALWGHPEGPWTRLNAVGSPFLSVSADTNWDDTSLFMARLCIVGNKLYMAYGGTASGLTPMRVGLASATIAADGTIGASTRLTSANPLALGDSPYRGNPAGLHYMNGKFYLWVQRYDDSGGTAIPRLYTNNAYATTGWQYNMDLPEYGTYDGTGAGAIGELPGCVMPLDAAGDTWLWSHQNNSFSGGTTLNKIEVDTIQIQPNRVLLDRLGVVLVLGSSGAWDDYAIDSGGRLLWHEGAWHLFYAGKGASGEKNHAAYGGTYQYDTAVSQSGSATMGRTTFQRPRIEMIDTSGAAVTAPADTETNTLATVTIPALGPNDVIEVDTLWTTTNNANVKIAKITLGTDDFLSTDLASKASGRITRAIANANSTSAQVGYNASSVGSYGVGSGANATGTTDTSVPTTLTITMAKATGGDTVTLESYFVKVIREGTL